MLWVGDTTKGLSHRDPWTEKGLINLMPNILGKLKYLLYLMLVSVNTISLLSYTWM